MTASQASASLYYLLYCFFNTSRLTPFECFVARLVLLVFWFRSWLYIDRTETLHTLLRTGGSASFHQHLSVYNLNLVSIFIFILLSSDARMECFRQIARLVKSPFQRDSHRPLEIVSPCPPRLPGFQVSQNRTNPVYRVLRPTFERRNCPRSSLTQRMSESFHIDIC